MYVCIYYTYKLELKVMDKNETAFCKNETFVLYLLIN